MAEQPKRLGAITSTVAVTGEASSGQILYTVPASTSAIVSTVIVCNRGGASGTFRLAHVDGGGVAQLADEDYLYYDVTIPGNDTFTATIGLGMEATDSLVIKGSLEAINFVAEGIEITA